MISSGVEEARLKHVCARELYGLKDPRLPSPLAQAAMLAQIPEDVVLEGFLAYAPVMGMVSSVAASTTVSLASTAWSLGPATASATAASGP